MSNNPDWKSAGENIICEFMKSKKNSNCLLELEKLLLSPNEECVLSQFPIVVDLFTKIFSSGLLNIYSLEDEKEDAYRLWLLERYEDFVSHLLTYLSHDNVDIQVSALKTLLSLVKLENEFIRKSKKGNQHFPLDLFKKIVSALASDTLNQHSVIKVFQKYTKYHDIKLYLLKSIMVLLQESRIVSELFLQNCFFLLYSMKYPKLSANTKSETFAYTPDSETSFQLNEKMFRKLFSSVWKCFLNYEFSPNFLRKVLPAFNENILPHLQNPCLVTDFLTNAYNKGGILSLLALKGLHHLMDKYNLDYPNFFVQLYALVNKNIVNGEFSILFFEQTDLFLSSTHLPAHIVAAFVKKLSHLCLVSSTDTILKILCLISNLLVNHPSLGGLIHQTDSTVYNKDPFCFSALNPAESDAVKSSLWEIEVLQSHVNPNVSIKAKELMASHPKFYSNVSDISSTSLQVLYRNCRKRKLNDVPLAVHRPSARQKCS